MKRWLLSFLVLALFPAGVGALSRSADSGAASETAALRSIAHWLKTSGRNGYLAAEVADAAGIGRAANEDLLEAWQRGFRSEGVLRIAQVSADEKRDFMLFMVQQPDGEVYFHVATLRDGLRKSFISIPDKQLVVPLERNEAEERFQREIVYWESVLTL